MKIFLLSSTINAGRFDPATKITFQIGDGPIEHVERPTTEPQALLDWAAEVVEQVERGILLEIFSKPNSLSAPFDHGWIERWKEDGFKSKPKEHRERWRTLIGALKVRQIELKFEHPPESELHSRLSPPHSPDPPGSPVENPWAKGETQDELLDRALKKKP